jgi:putative flippase GtrA
MSPIISIFTNSLKRTNSFFRFALVGAINTIAGLTVTFILLNGLHMDYWISTFTGNTLGAAVSFLLNRNFTFKSSTPFGKGALRFTAVILVSYFSSYSLSDCLINYINADLYNTFSPNEASVMLGAIFYTVSNYIGQKYIVFREAADPKRSVTFQPDKS